MKDINEAPIETVIEEIKKHLADGWSLSLARRKSGIILPRGAWIFNTPEYKAIAHAYKRGWQQSRGFNSWGFTRSKDKPVENLEQMIADSRK